MSVGNLSDPVLITRPAALTQMAEDLARQPIIAVDTESNSLFAYREQVCLLQFSTPANDYLVDPFALADLSALAPIFSNPNIEKVFHAADYDLLGLKRDYGFTFENLFDTMIAARILGREAIGLGAMLEAEFGLQIDKRFQRANWGQRPLPRPLLDYARLDTHYLIALRDRLREMLVRQNLWPLALEDFRRISLVHENGRAPEERTVDCWRVSGSYDLSPQQAAVLLELCKYRDEVARAQNRPLFKVLHDQTLIDIAVQAPRSLEQLNRISSLSPLLIKRHGRKLLAAVERGLQHEPVYPPRHVRPSEDFLDRLEALRRWRKETAQEMGVKSDVVLPRDLLFNLAENNPRQHKDLAAVMNDVPWRLERFGNEILSVLTRG